MAIDTLIIGLINLIAGVLILLFPAALRVIVGTYLLLSGVITIFVYLL